MMSGMGRIFSYVNFPYNPEVPDPKKAIKKLYADDRKIHAMAKIGLESTGTDGELIFSNTRFQFQTEWRIGLNAEKGYESESHFGRYLGKMQWWFPYVGWDFRYRKMDPPEKDLFSHVNTKDRRMVFFLEFNIPCHCWLRPMQDLIQKESSAFNWKEKMFRFQKDYDLILW